MQKKLMLRPSAVPTENLPPEITDKDYIERPDSPYQPDNSSNSYVSLDQSDSSIIPLNDYTDEQGMVVTDNLSNQFNYHSNNISFTSTPTIASSAIINIQPTISYEQVNNLTALSTVPYQEITETSYSLYDGTEIDRRTLASVLNKDDYQENGQTITYVVNYVDYWICKICRRMRIVYNNPDIYAQYYLSQRKKKTQKTKQNITDTKQAHLYLILNLQKKAYSRSWLSEL